MPRSSAAPTSSGRTPRAGVSRIAAALRQETVGGALLLVAAVVGLVWANSPWAAAYESLRAVTVGPESLRLNLSVGTWAADGLLAIFFFVAGLELKREFVAGDLRNPRKAAVPIAAAVGGVALPAVLYLAVNRAGAAQGWAIASATDIAFALAVLAVVGRFLPSALRTFLLTLAIVDDLVAILIVALFYTDDLAVAPLLWAVAPLAVFTVLVRRRVFSWWSLLPLAGVTWALVHASGVHATVAGVLLGLVVPVARHAADERRGRPGPAEHLEHRFRPLSAGVAVPVFALLAAGVPIGGYAGFASALSDPVSIGIVLGLVVGKSVGILGTTWLVSRLTRTGVGEGVGRLDLVGVALLGGIGFTVSLLIGELAFGEHGDTGDHARVAILTGSLVAALLGALVLRARDRVHRRAYEEGRLPSPPPGSRRAG